MRKKNKTRSKKANFYCITKTKNAHETLIYNHDMKILD